YGLFMDAPAAIAILEGPSLVFELVNPAEEALLGRNGLVGRALAEALPGPRFEWLRARCEEVYRRGEPFAFRELPIEKNEESRAEAGRRASREGAGREPAFVSGVVQPTRNARGEIDGVV